MQQECSRLSGHDGPYINYILFLSMRPVNAGLKEATQEMVQKKSDGAGSTPWEKYLEKKKDKRKERKEQKKKLKDTTNVVIIKSFTSFSHLN